jgi:PIN domain nuclease of toxin-antitoxin system
MIWFSAGVGIVEPAAAIIDHAAVTDGVFISPISAWEIGMLCRPRIGRPPAVQFTPDARAWFAQVLAGSGVRLAPLTPEIAIDSSYLPGALHGDPADRFIVATARHLDIPLVTRDRRLLAYGAEGYARVIRC